MPRSAIALLALVAGLLLLIGCNRFKPATTDRREEVSGLSVLIPAGVAAESFYVAEKRGLKLQHPASPGEYVRIAPSRWRLGSSSAEDALKRRFEEAAAKYERERPKAVRAHSPALFRLGELPAYGGDWNLDDGTRFSINYTHVGKRIFLITAIVVRAPANEAQREGQGVLKQAIAGLRASKP